MARKKPKDGKGDGGKGRAKQPPVLRPNELALVGVGLTIFVLALGALVGVGLASWLFGRGWLWPADVSGGARELGHLLTGRLHDRRLPSLAALWTVVVLVELAALAAAIGFARWAGDVVRPATVASASERAPKAEIAAAFGRRQLPHSGSRRFWQRGPVAPAWRLGRAQGVDVWLPFERTVGVIGPAASGKTLDVVTHAALAAPGPLVLAAPKPDDMLLSVTRRGEPVAVLDPFGAVPGLPALTWDPLHGCIDSTVATRRARAFCTATGAKDCEHAAKVLQCYLHAAALTGRTIDHVVTWVADPVATDVPETILREHPYAEPHWADLLHGALRSGVPATTMQRAVDALLHKEIAQRVLPSTRHPATDLAGLLKQNGTIYLLGTDDSVVTVSPLLAAVADEIVALAPPDTVFVSDGPLPLPTRPARLIWSAPEPGPDADLLVYVGTIPSKTVPSRLELELRDREAAVVAPGVPPFVVRLQRATEGKPGAELLAHLEQVRERATAAPATPWHSRDPARSALVAAHERGLHPDTWRQR
jgi:type IV secretion system protein VirD4